MVLNLIALWKQEPRDPARNRTRRPRHRHSARRGASLPTSGRAGRFLVAVGLGTAAFSMQDILLEPYGGEILRLAVAATTTLTAILAGGTLVAFALAARRLGRGDDPYRLAGYGALIGIAAFSAVIFAAPLDSACAVPRRHRADRLRRRPVRRRHADRGHGARRAAPSGLALGAWGAVQASAAGVAHRARRRDPRRSRHAGGAGVLGPALTAPAIGYSVVYHLEIVLLFATLVAIGPLVRPASASCRRRPTPVRPRRVPGLAACLRRSPWQSGAITEYIDVAQLVLYAFWIFFFGWLIFTCAARTSARAIRWNRPTTLGGRVDRAGLPADPDAEDLPPRARRHGDVAATSKPTPTAPGRALRALAGRAARADRQPHDRRRRSARLRAARRGRPT